MIDKKYQVFVSSTFVDLEDERRTVIEQILNLGHIPVGMELFQAGDDTQWEYIKRRIRDCDYYTVIVAERYGSESKGKSYTQMEYEYAVKMKIPVIAFLLHSSERGSWPSKKTEFEKHNKIEVFRKLCERKLVRFWKNADDLGAKFTTSLIELTSTKPRTGWVKADSVATNSALNEITTLLEEKRVLQLQINELQGRQSGIVIPAYVLYKIEMLNSQKLENYCASYDGNPITKVEDVSLLTCLLDISHSLASGIEKYSAGFELHKYIHTSTGGISILDRFFSEIATNNIIDNEVYQSYTFERPSTQIRYKLTEFGREFIVYSRYWFEKINSNINELSK